MQLGANAAVKVLLARGAAVDARDGQGRTALMWAAQDGRAETAKLLLRAKADAGLKGVDGRTASAIAAARGHAAIVELLPAAAP